MGKNSSKITQLLGDNTIKSALHLFKKVAIDLGVDKLRASGYGGSVTTLQVIHEDAWLGPLMLASDEFSMMETGKRLWDVYYVIDDVAIEGYKPFSKDLVEKNDVTQLYDRYGVHGTEFPVASRYLFAKQALHKLLSLADNNEITIDVLSGYYSNYIDKMPVHGDVFPFQSMDEINIVSFKSFLDSSKGAYKKVELGMNHQITREVEVK